MTRTTLRALFRLRLAGGRRAQLELRRQEELRDAVETLRQSERERARLFDEVVSAGEEERVRVAGELHDGPIQQLTALALTLDLIDLQLARGDVAAVAIAVGKARQTASEQMLALRRLMAELRPPALDEIGLEAALRDYAAQYERDHGVRLEFSGDLGELRLGEGVETTLYRVAQEALANVAKHSGAELVRVELRRDGGEVRLLVADDGVGFEETPLSDVVSGGHFGLVGMRERVERAGGEWRLSSATGRGTVVDVMVPAAPALRRAA